MMEKKINVLADMLVEYNLIAVEQRDEYRYALVCLIENFITTGSILLISLLLGNVIPTIGFLVFFFSLRKRSGGYHVSTFGGCYIRTLITYGMVVWCSTWLGRNIHLLMALTVAAGICILVVGTVNHPNIHMGTEELQSAKKASRTMLILELAVIFSLVWINRDVVFVTYISIAVILCAVLLMTAKITGQEVK